MRQSSVRPGVGPEGGLADLVLRWPYACPTRDDAALAHHEHTVGETENSSTSAETTSTDVPDAADHG